MGQTGVALRSPPQLGGPQDEDKPISSGPTFLNRNKTERTRLQGLVRTMSGSSGPSVKAEGLTFAQRAKVWMVNDGEVIGGVLC